MTGTMKPRAIFLFVFFVAAAIFATHPASGQSGNAPSPRPSGSPNPTPQATNQGVGIAIQSTAQEPVVSPPLRELARQPQPTPPSRYVTIGKLEGPELRYRLMEHFPNVRYCDPYCIPNCRRDGLGEDELRGFAKLKEKDPATLAAIAEHEGWKGKTEFSNADKAVIYFQYLKLSGSVRLEPAEHGYKFELSDTEPLPGSSRSRNGFPNRTQGYRIEGIIVPPDKITVLRKTPASVGCPK